MTDYKQVADYLVEQTQLWFERYAGFANLYEANAVIGISGGKDSSVVAAILCKALSPKQVHGVLMPNGYQQDIQYSRDLCALLGIRSMTVNIEDPVDSLMFEIQHYGGRDYTELYGFDQDSKITTNLPARIRMATLYAVAAALNGRVIGTGNYSEAMLGYTTLWGDSACDFNPIGNLYVDEVIAVGEALGLPEKFTLKPPSDGMCGKTDEENLGFTYDQFRQVDIGDALSVDDEAREKIKSKMLKSRFKRKLLSSIPTIPIYRDDIDGTLGAIDLEATVTNNLVSEKTKSLY